MSKLGESDDPDAVQPEAAEPAKFEVKLDRSIIGALGAGDGSKAEGKVTVHNLHAGQVYLVASGTPEPVPAPASSKESPKPEEPVEQEKRPPSGLGTHPSSTINNATAPKDRRIASAMAILILVVTVLGMGTYLFVTTQHGQAPSDPIIRFLKPNPPKIARLGDAGSVDSIRTKHPVPLSQTTGHAPDLTDAGQAKVCIPALLIPASSPHVVLVPLKKPPDDWEAGPFEQFYVLLSSRIEYDQVADDLPLDTEMVFVFDEVDVQPENDGGGITCLVGRMVSFVSFQDAAGRDHARWPFWNKIDQLPPSPSSSPAAASLSAWPHASSHIVVRSPGRASTSATLVPPVVLPAASSVSGGRSPEIDKARNELRRAYERALPSCKNLGSPTRLVGA
jgi:hypothetical protein